MICGSCEGSGAYETTIGGDGYGGRCSALADVECVCGECGGSGQICPICYSQSVVLGLLGDTKHLRCTACGIGFTEEK